VTLGNPARKKQFLLGNHVDPAISDTSRKLYYMNGGKLCPQYIPASRLLPTPQI
jgi:hypothetical protein